MPSSGVLEAADAGDSISVDRNDVERPESPTNLIELRAARRRQLPVRYQDHCA